MNTQTLTQLKAYAGDSDSKASRADVKTELIDRFIDDHKSAQDVVYRGINVDFDYLESLSMYDVIALGNGNDPVSTTKQKAFARQWAEMKESDVIIIFRIAGASGVDLCKCGIQNARQEQEVLLHSATSGFVTGIEEDGYTVFVDIKIK